MDERKKFGSRFFMLQTLQQSISLKCLTKVEDFSSHIFSTDFSDFRLSLLRRTLWALAFPNVQTPLFFSNGPIISVSPLDRA